MLIPLNATQVINEEVLEIRLKTDFLLYKPDEMLLNWKTLSMSSK